MDSRADRVGGSARLAGLASLSSARASVIASGLCRLRPLAFST